MKRPGFVAAGCLAIALGGATLAPSAAGAAEPTMADHGMTTDVTDLAATEPQVVAYVSGDQEVPRSASTAWAWAVFELSADGESLQVSARVFHLTDPVMAHLHLGARGTNGPVVVPLPVPAEPGETQHGQPDTHTGHFAGPEHDVHCAGCSADIEATVTADTLTGPLAGMTVNDLFAAIQAGDIYMNVHTTAYPGGEIRGQAVTWS